MRIDITVCTAPPRQACWEYLAQRHLLWGPSESELPHVIGFYLHWDRRDPCGDALGAVHCLCSFLGCDLAVGVFTTINGAISASECFIVTHVGGLGGGPPGACQGGPRSPTPPVIKVSARHDSITDGSALPCIQLQMENTGSLSLGVKVEACVPRSSPGCDSALPYFMLNQMMQYKVHHLLLLQGQAVATDDH